MCESEAILLRKVNLFSEEYNDAKERQQAVASLHRICDQLLLFVARIPVHSV